MDVKRVTPLALYAAILLASRPAFAPPPASVPDAPGRELAHVESYLLAPLTLYTRFEVGSKRETRVQWFSTDGRLEHELHDVEPYGAFVTQRDTAGARYISVANPRWEAVIPKSRGEGPTGLVLGGTPDGRTFVYSSRTTGGDSDEWPRVPTTISMYIEGERKTLGPYPGGPGEIHVDLSGALAVRMMSGQLIIADRDGHERFRMTIGISRENRVLACNERGVLIADSNQRKPIQYYGFDGARASFTIPGHLGALPLGGSRWLFHTTLDSLLAVDAEKGRILWRTGPRGERVIMSSEAFGVAGPYLIAAGAELWPSRGEWPRNVLRALDLETGALQATWDCGCTRPGSVGRVQLMPSGGKLYCIDGQRSSLIDPQQIRAGAEGWRSSQPPEPAPPAVKEGPPDSPLTWKPLRARRKGDVRAFAPAQRIAPFNGNPRSVTLAHLKDDRPYGESAERDVWIAVYDSILVRADSARSAVVRLSGAFDAQTGDLVCAFTDPAPRWMRSVSKPRDVEAEFKQSKQVLPAAYASLRSTPAELLAEMWRVFGIDPRNAAQIVMRPRFITAEFPARPFEGRYIPVRQPSNQWIVEVLGTVTPLGGYEWTTLVALFLDGDLTMYEGHPAP